MMNCFGLRPWSLGMPGWLIILIGCCVMGGPSFSQGFVLEGPGTSESKNLSVDNNALIA